MNDCLELTVIDGFALETSENNLDHIDEPTNLSLQVCSDSHGIAVKHTESFSDSKGLCGHKLLIYLLKLHLQNIQ